MKQFTFYMNDAWGDHYSITINANSEQEARGIATMIDDDAIPGKLLKVENERSN